MGLLELLYFIAAVSTCSVSKSGMCFLNVFFVLHWQLSASSVEVASQILLKLGRMLKSKHKRIKDQWIEARDLLSQKFIQSATRVTSNLIEAASLLMQRYDAVPCSLSDIFSQ